MEELGVLCVYDEGRLVGGLGNEEVETEGYSKYKKNNCQGKNVLEAQIYRNPSLFPIAV